jgi:hypothetical protein
MSTMLEPQINIAWEDNVEIRDVSVQLLSLKKNYDHMKKKNVLKEMQLDRA